MQRRGRRCHPRRWGRRSVARRSICRLISGSRFWAPSNVSPRGRRRDSKHEHVPDSASI